MRLRMRWREVWENERRKNCGEGMDENWINGQVIIR